MGRRTALPQVRGASVLEEALAGEKENGKEPFFYDAELARMRAELLLELGGEASAPAAEACLRQALKTVERQEARLPALRAAVDLARLWQGQGSGDEACALLSQHYLWFGKRWRPRIYVRQLRC